MDARIKSISFLDKEEKRQRVFSDDNGFFPVRITGSSAIRDYPMKLNAKELVARVFEGDPVIELFDRSRLRVRQGGTGHMRVDAECVIMSHDKHYAKKR